MVRPSLQHPEEVLLAGLMSGTSLDGIDVCLVRLLPAPRPQVTLLGWRVYPYADELRERLSRAVRGKVIPAELARLNVELGSRFAGSVRDLLADLAIPADQVAAIGSHGHTIFHDPGGHEGTPPCTWQIGEGAVIAADTGITTVFNFRPADVALGGQGAPLVAWADHYLFGGLGRCLALQNLGGIANVTVLPGDGDPGRVLAFDTGPGNMVIDRLAERLSGGRLAYDRDGRQAAAGRAHPGLLGRWLGDPYFLRPPPKSTGRERFGHPYADRLWREARRHRLKDEDLLATATELTARSVADAYLRYVLPRYPVCEIIASGGGVRNLRLMQRLGECLAPIPVVPIDRYGIPADIKEAVAFALLAYAALAGLPGNLPAATGATGPAILGQIGPGRNYRSVRLGPLPLPALSDLPLTEQRHPLTEDLDRCTVRQILELMNREDRRAVEAVGEVLPDVERAVECVQAALRRGGRLYYVGAGTSGRLGVLDAVECPPTFSSDPLQVQALLAGGEAALTRAVEGAEDDEEAGIRAIRERRINDRDVVLGITASGTTPFVRAALREAHERGAGTILLCCNALKELDPALDRVLEVPVGPEILTGSTRLKAGTAMKLILNMITTVAMIRLGKVFSNLMVDLYATNTKLRHRAVRILQTLTPLGQSEAEKLLKRARGKVKVALVMWKHGVSCQQAARLLKKYDGFLRPLW